jgi:hypothetical protein
MRRITKYRIQEQLNNINPKEGNPLSKKEIVLFKYLNNNKKEAGTKPGLISLIRGMLQIMGIPDEQSAFYYEIYTQNYRPKGDYENLTYETFKNVKDFKQKKITNSNSRDFVIGKIPFKGSNLEGYWDVNNQNQWYYVVKSYGWYPIFLYIDNKWFEVSQRYSSSTGKQMSKARPHRYSSEVEDRIYSVTKNEMSDLIHGQELTTIEKDRVNNFIKDFKIIYPNTKKTITIGYWDDRKRVSFNIDNVSKSNDKIKFTISVLKAGPVVDRKMIISPEGYQTDRNFVDIVENGIKHRIISDNPDYLSQDNTIFEFIHK